MFKTNTWPCVGSYKKIQTSFEQCTVSSLMFVGINVCILEIKVKPGSRGLISAVSSGLVNYLGTHE